MTALNNKTVLRDAYLHFRQDDSLVDPIPTKAEEERHRFAFMWGAVSVYYLLHMAMQTERMQALPTLMQALDREIELFAGDDFPGWVSQEEVAEILSAGAPIAAEIIDVKPITNVRIRK